MHVSRQGKYLLPGFQRKPHTWSLPALTCTTDPRLQKTNNSIHWILGNYVDWPLRYTQCKGSIVLATPQNPTTLAFLIRHAHLNCATVCMAIRHHWASQKAFAEDLTSWRIICKEIGLLCIMLSRLNKQSEESKEWLLEQLKLPTRKSHQLLPYFAPCCILEDIMGQSWCAKQHGPKLNSLAKLQYKKVSIFANKRLHVQLCDNQRPYIFVFCSQLLERHVSSSWILSLEIMFLQNKLFLILK